jgi:cell division protein ZapA
MGQISVNIGGRSYPLACGDGEEAHLTELAEHLQRKADELTGALGTMSEPRLLLMAGILVADELFEVRKKNGAPDPAELARFAKLAARAEALAAAIEQTD